MSLPANSAYRRLESTFHRLGALGEAGRVLNWDASTMMPPGGSAARAEQLAALHAVGHEILSSRETAELMAAAEHEVAGLDAWQQANLREMRRNWIHATAIPTRLVEERARATMACEMIWREARPNNDFAAVRPALETVVRLTRETADAVAQRLELAPYDALMDEYSPGLRMAAVDTIFGTLAEALPPMIERALAHQTSRPAPRVPKGPFAAARQREVGMEFMKVLGFDFSHGRLDESLHPFSGGTSSDLRITTRYDDADFTRGLMGILHETGHALYDQGLPADWHLQPVGEARGMDVHESQSLLIEMQVCRSREFLAFAAPRLRAAFGTPAADEDAVWGVDNLVRLYTRVERGLIRVDADEMTYPLHIILRTRLERAILAGDLAVADIPGAWNAAMRDLLEVVPAGDAQGCLQDIHWYDGAFGYFPSYTLGALAAAQLFAAATAADAAIRPGIAAGDFRPLYAWLRAWVHGRGALYETPELIERATGKPLSAQPFLAHLERRYFG